MSIIQKLFSQLFGCKVGTALMGQVAPILTAYLTINPGADVDAATNYVNLQLDKVIASIAKSLKIPAMFSGLLTSYVESVADDYILHQYTVLKAQGNQ